MLKHLMRNAIKMKKELSEMCLINMRSFNETCQTFPGLLARDILKAMTAVYSIRLKIKGSEEVLKSPSYTSAAFGTLEKIPLVKGNKI